MVPSLTRIAGYERHGGQHGVGQHFQHLQGEGPQQLGSGTQPSHLLLSIKELTAGISTQARRLAATHLLVCGLAGWVHPAVGGQDGCQAAHQLGQHCRRLWAEMHS